jgi:CBS domain-containing protein
MTTYHPLRVVPLAGVECVERPEGELSLDLESPALKVFTDFKVRAPFMLEKSTQIDEAIEIMRRTHVKQMLVIDAQEAFRGVISLSDLLSVKVARAAASTGLKREDLGVAHVMTSRTDLHAVEYPTLTSAKIGDLLKTMESYGDHYLLVVDRQSSRLRGIVSATEIGRALHSPVSITARANSFAEICRVVQH